MQKYDTELEPESYVRTVILTTLWEEVEGSIVSSMPTNQLVELVHFII